MHARLVSASQKEANLSIRESDIGILYIVQHELLKKSGIEFAGVILKHQLTSEIWMRVNTSSGSPVKAITDAADASVSTFGDLEKLFKSKIKVDK
ncbi:hypothetical protein CENSYa_1420 [Cenarchaeum symbiosum A]|uniref:DNA-directed RNA polymerase subunit Rpo11 n=1 Tax=Cenarchaeum symbiosum (strain A) TaxID=414004 RepID=A0RXH5_CENSY|nr:hypothetical protein CENSYa_1420 [Cenarchaeum symbiosum A]